MVEMVFILLFHWTIFQPKMFAWLIDVEGYNDIYHYKEVGVSPGVAEGESRQAAAATYAFQKNNVK